MRPRAFLKRPVIESRFPLQVRKVRTRKVGVRKRLRLLRNPCRMRAGQPIFLTWRLLCAHNWQLLPVRMLLRPQVWPCL